MSRIYRVGELTLDAGRQELRCGANPVHVGPLTYRLLLALVEAAPNMIGHDALVDSVWGGRAVSNETVSQRVKLLREAIGDNAHEPRYIELLRGRGYRLIPPVEMVSAKAAERRPNARAIGLGTMMVLAAAALIWFVSSSYPVPRSNLSIAVLPFADMSPDQNQEYLADGIAAEILNLLSRSTPLQVTARTSSFSFKDANADVAKIAEKLNVSYVLEGSVRKSGTRIRINAQLVSAADGIHVWSDTYDREIGDVLSLQEEIAGSVAAALETNLVGDPLVDATPKRIVPDAFTAYLRGQQQLRIHSDVSLAKAARYFERSVEIDPSFLPAYSGMGLIYVLQIVDLHVTVAENLPKLRAVVQQGLEFAPGDSGLIALSALVSRYEGNIDLADQRLGRALELDPSNIPVLKLYAMFKLDQSYPDEALQVYRRLVERDPLNSELYIGIWACHMDLGNAREAIAATMRYDEVAPAPNPPFGVGMRGITRALLLGDIAGSIRDETQGAADSYAYPLLYYTLGDQEKGDAALEQWRQNLATDALGTIPYTLAYRYLLTGETAKARELALESFTARDDFSAGYDDYIVARLTIDALIAGGEAERAVELIQTMAPVYATYRSRPNMHPREFSPAPYSVKGSFSSYPAYYFPDYIRALRAAGDAAGADNMLRHLEAILQWRRKRGLFIEGRHVAEARILRGDVNGALDALERAERDGTIYVAWHAFLLHNEIFAGIRQHPRFEALIARVTDEMRRQRTELEGNL